MKNKRIFLIILALTFCVVACPLRAVPAEVEPYSAEVWDISDRAYEKAVIDLLDSAKDSITISMFVLKPGKNDKHPINRLMKDLEEALERGVAVQIYLNTKGWKKSFPIGKTGKNKVFDLLREKGAQIYPITSRYMLHDKMIIVDSRFVVIGSANWSVSALTDNLESTVLIDCPALAEERLKRMKSIHLKGESLRDPPQISVEEIHPLPETIELPSALMIDARYFPGMLSTHDNRAMDLYLLLIAESYRRDSKEFSVSLERIAGQLGLPKKWSAAALRRQAIKSLRKLENTYGLIDVRFKHSRAAEVTLIEIKGETFPVKSIFFRPSFFTTTRQNKKFMLLVGVYLEHEGKFVGYFTYSELAEMFGVDRTTISEGMEK